MDGSKKINVEGSSLYETLIKADPHYRIVHILGENSSLFLCSQ